MRIVPAGLAILISLRGRASVAGARATATGGRDTKITTLKTT